MKVDKAILREIILEEVDALIESGELDEGYWDVLKSKAATTFSKDAMKKHGQKALARGLKGVGLSKAGEEASQKAATISRKQGAQQELDMMRAAMNSMSALRKDYLSNLRQIKAASRENEFDNTVISKDAQLGPYIEAFAKNISRWGEWMGKTIEQAQIAAGRTDKGQDTSGTGLFKDEEAAQE